MENEYLKPYFDNTERLENLSYAIGYYRKEKGLSQEQLAEKLGISRQHLAAVEAPRIVVCLSNCSSTSPLCWKLSHTYC